MEPRAALVCFPTPSRFEQDGLVAVPPEDAEPVPRVKDVVLLFDGVTSTPEIVNQRRVDFQRLFREGGRLILLIGPGVEGATGVSLGRYLLTVLHFNLLATDLDVLSQTPPLDRYFQDQTAHAVILRVEDEYPMDILALGDPAMEPVAARFQYQNAEIFIMPIRSNGDCYGAARTLLELLPSGGEYPRYLDEFLLGKEAELRQEKEQVAARLETIESELTRLESAKGILYRTDFDLESEVIRFMNDHLNIRARSGDKPNREDFWLLDGGGKELVIGEVKSPGKQNVVKGDVGALMSHRTEAGKPDDFPGLLVVNALHRKKTLKERDVGVPQPVVRLAGENGILIMRTLDLFRIHDRQLMEADRPDVLAEAKRGGWLEVDALGKWKHHGASSAA
jgi:hypothetical protein